MGGDHKCPVCQATFTRPQHVARHMRSHTGDRPYKCQYCGDQFARSDLLSRHVNKCHANEKPLPNTGARRKGTTSASRATTSKQACDQCVQSSLPCDGCNPCSKCVSRKCRCTYVKFHRQTAPVGPGHNVRSNAPPAPVSGDPVPFSSAFSSSSPSSSRLLYQQSEDDFILGPAPSSGPTMAEALYSSNSFSFPPLYPSNDLNTLPEGVDYTKFRTQQADIFGPGRSGLSTGLTPLYDPRQVTSTQGTSSWLSDWETQDAQNAYQQSQRQAEFLPEEEPNAPAIHDKHLDATGHFIGNSNSSNPGDNAQPIMPYTLPRLHLVVRPSEQERASSSFGSSKSNSRRGSVDFSGSESASASGQASGSMPSSATSSSVHLPLGGVDYGNPTSYNLDDSNMPNRNATSSPSSQHRDYGRYAPQDDRQEFSSAFGLMSLDDPAVLAGISVDGQPFFDDPSQAHNQHRSSDPEQNHDGLLTTDIGPDIDTPMPLRRDAGRIQMPAINGRPATATGAASSNTGGSGTMFGIGNLPTPSKDVDARELREFWRQYLRSPLTTSQDAGPEGKMSPPSSHRRQRVSSLPSVKTPMMERGDIFLHLGYHPSQQQDQRRGEKGAGVQQGPMSSLRTTLHVKEDLSSYEAAVLARKAPTLNLQLKRPGRANVHGPFPAPNQQGRNDSRYAKESVEFDSRPPSSAGLSSFSFANAFGEQTNGSISMSSSGSLRLKEESDSPSLSSSRATSVDNSAQSESESRPSFKRLASHTLGPECSKRTFFGYGDEILERDNTVGWSTDPHAIGRMYSGGVCQGMIHQLDRGAASIAERRRRSTASSIDALKFSHERGENSRF